MEGIKKRVESLLEQKNRNSTAGSLKISQHELKNAGLDEVLLRDYQLFGVQWLYKCFVTGHGCILGDEMGLGKTVQVIALLLHIKSQTTLSNKPCLVICPLSVLGNWQAEFSRFSPSLKILTFTGDKEKRTQLKKDFHTKFNTGAGGQQIDVILTTYEICMKESSFLNTISCEVLVVDEAHRLKNHQSILYQELIQFDHKVAVLLTGTPIQNNLKELYALLSFVVPTIFPIASINQFVADFSDVTNSNQESMKLQGFLRPFLLRREKSEINLGLPKKSEVVLFTGMSDLQKKYYKALLLKDHGVFAADNSNRTRLLNVLMQLRKCANHPYLFNGVEPEPFALGEHLVEASGKLKVIDHLLRFLKKRNHKVLLFSQMVTMLDIIQDYLGFRGYSYERLDGSVRGEERYLAIKNFNETDETFIFLLSTRAGGVGLNLVSADTVIFVDSDFNPQNDLQAAARAHRIGQTREVRIIRLLARDTVDEIFYQRAQDKLRLTNTVIEGSKFSHGVTQITSTKEELIKVLKFGFNKLSESEQSELTDEDLVRTLGRTENGQWTTKTKDESDEERTEEQPCQSNMYVYEGRDYSKEAMEADKKAFDLCVADLANLETSERGSRRKGQPLVGGLPGETRQRKEYTAEELEERRQKRAETAAKRETLKVAEEKRRAEEKKIKLEKLWSDSNYISLNIDLKDEADFEDDDQDNDEGIEDNEDEEGTRREREIHYVIGDVTHPQKSADKDAIIVHCVDDSGKWGSGGLFSAVSVRSRKPEEQYELAGAMHDLHLGDVHLISLESGGSDGEGNDFVALIVCQTRDRRQRISPINLASLSDAMKKIQQVASEMKASVHFPRIGYATPSFNWYATERLIKKHLASKKTPTFIYYYSRKRPSHARTSEQTTSTVSSVNQKKRKTPFLPDIFSDVKVYFHEMAEDEKRKLGRYVIAYNGDVDTFLTAATTHIICTSTSSELVQNLPPTSAAIVSKTWLEECLRKGQVIDCDEYLVAR